MTHHQHSPGASKNDDTQKRPFLYTAAGITLCVFFAIAGVLLWVEHRAHLLGALPLLLPLLICGGMHFFMHRGHGGHQGRQHGKGDPRDER